MTKWKIYRKISAFLFWFTSLINFDGSLSYLTRNTEFMFRFSSTSSRTQKVQTYISVSQSVAENFFFIIGPTTITRITEAQWRRIKQRRCLRVGTIFIQCRPPLAASCRRRRRRRWRQQRQRQARCSFHGNGNASSLMWRWHGNGGESRGPGVDGGTSNGRRVTPERAVNTPWRERSARYRATTFFVHLRALFRAAAAAAAGSRLLKRV